MITKDEILNELYALRDQVHNLTLYLRRVEEICEATGNGLWGELVEHFDGLPGYGEAEDAD